jgi:hypothetical protein
MVSLAALVGCPFWARPSHCTPSALHVTLGWCDHVYPRWDGHTTDILQFPYVLGAPVSLIGSELSAPMGSGPSLCPAPMPKRLSYVLYRGYGLGGRKLLSLENVFAGRCLCRVNFIYFIDVGRVVVTKSAVNVIHFTVGSEDRVILWTTEQIVLTETAIYAVVTLSATYLVVTTAAVAVVVACQTYDGVCGTEPVDAVQLTGALEVILLKCAPYVFGQRHPAEHDHSYQQRPAK